MLLGDRLMVSGLEGRFFDITLNLPPAGGHSPPGNETGSLP
jgi:hypothetical protein